MVNDFTALARSRSGLSARERSQVGGRAARPQGVIGVIGPAPAWRIGPDPGRGRRLDHPRQRRRACRFRPADEREVFVLRYAWRELDHVSAERLVSGPGIELIHRALAARAGVALEGRPQDAAGIVSRALEASDALCVEVVECFCAMLGTIASDVAVTLGRSAASISAGIVPRPGELFHRSAFRRRFEDKAIRALPGEHPDLRDHRGTPGIPRRLGNPRPSPQEARKRGRKPLAGEDPQRGAQAVQGRAAGRASAARAAAEFSRTRSPTSRRTRR